MNFMKFRGILFLNFIAEIPYIAIMAMDSDFKISVSWKFRI
ncbi:hypothetical protein [uncultured Campylobacter sp.]|nr:hypothetical protein [uncultured Campylobacter sp.]